MGLDISFIRQQVQSLIAQRDQAAHTFQQCVGAISILEEQVRFIVEMEMAANEASKEAVDCSAVMDTLCEGVQEYVKVDGETEEQAT